MSAGQDQQPHLLFLHYNAEKIQTLKSYITGQTIHINGGSVDLDFKGAIKYSRSVAENYSELLSQAKKIKKFAKKGQKDEIKGKMAQMIQKKQLFFYFSAFYKVWARTLGATHPNLRY